jgi:hypothetical protein
VNINVVITYETDCSRWNNIWNIASGIEIKSDITIYAGQEYEVKSICAVEQVHNQRNVLKSLRNFKRRLCRDKINLNSKGTKFRCRQLLIIKAFAMTIKN